MIKSIYLALTVCFTLVTVFIFAQTLSEIIHKRDRPEFILITFKKIIDENFESKFGEEKYQKLFTDSNQKLKEKKQLLLYTKEKYMNDIKRNNNVLSISNNTKNSILKKEENNFYHLPLLIEDDNNIFWSSLFPFVFFFTLINWVVFIYISIKKK